VESLNTSVEEIKENKNKCIFHFHGHCKDVKASQLDL
jgi:hypothetical protein